MQTCYAALADFPAATMDELSGDSFFASPLFADLWTTKGGRPVVWYLKDGEQIVAALPGVEFGKLFWKRFMSMPDGCYGGVFCHPDQETRRPHLVRKLLDTVLEAGYMRTFLFDFEGNLGHDERFEIMELETALVDISRPDWLPPDKKLQSQIRKAEREGIVVQPMDWDRHGGRFMEMMALTEKRHNRAPGYPRSFFRKLHQTSLRDGRLHWVWCEHQGQGVCSHIYVIEKGVLQGWQICFDKTFSFLKPNQYIRFTTCREMAGRGILWLNLGGTPDNAPGLEYYKKRWGGKTVHYRGLVNRQGLGRLV